MDHQFGVYLASPSRGCVPFHPDSYVNPFDPCPKAYSFIHTLINDPSSSDILSLLFDHYVCRCGASVPPFAPEGGFGAGLEPTVSRVHGCGLAFLRIECVLDHRSIHPTCPRLRSLRTHTILRE